MTPSPLLGGLVGALVGIGVFITIAGWFGLLDRPTTTSSSGPRVEHLALRASLAVGAAAALGLTTGWPVAMAGAATAGWSVPTFAGVRGSRRHQLARAEAIAVWAEMLRDLLISNAGLNEAIAKSARVAPLAIRDEVQALSVRARRGDLQEALARFAADLADPVADTVVAALLIADRRAVSDLGGLLSAVATSTRETVAMQLRINAVRARTYRTAQLIAVIVGFFIGLLVIANREYLVPFGTAVGQIVLAVAVGLIGVSLWAMVALSRPAQIDRLLTVGVGTGGSVMMFAGVLGAAFAAGLWLIARGLTASPRPLRTLSTELSTPRPVVALRETVKSPSSGRARWVKLADRLTGPASPRLVADLAVLQRTLARHTLDRLGYATLFASFVAVALAALPIAGVAVPALASVGSVALALVAGWTYPAAEVRSRARLARRSWAQTLTVYVDIAGISLAGGAGVEDALMTAAGAGVGPQFQQLAEALRVAQTRRQPLWTAMEELGMKSDIPLLRELAASVELAAESGTRIRETLIAKAGAMRIRQLTDVEAEAQRSSETMGVAPALMAVAAVVLIGYPALARFFEG